VVVKLNWATWITITLLAWSFVDCRAVAEEVQPPSGNELIRDAYARLISTDTLSARIRHQTNLFGQQLVGSGGYRQLRSAEGLKTRLELSIRTEEQSTSRRRISDGRFLWIIEIEGTTQQISRVDLRQIREAAVEKSGRLPTADTLAIEGLPGLLRSLEENFHFRKPHLIRFQGEPVWAIAGLWRPEKLASLLPGGMPAGSPIPIEQLPIHLPDRVFLLLGKSDLFPYRIEYRRSPADSAATTQAPAGNSASDLLLVMDYYRVNVGANIDPREFSFSPGDVQIVDRTSEFKARFTSQ
jgi:hypothetical protein